MQLHETEMGRIFFNGTMPRLIKNINELTKAVSDLTETLRKERDQKNPPATPQKVYSLVRAEEAFVRAQKCTVYESLDDAKTAMASEHEISMQAFVMFSKIAPDMEKSTLNEMSADLILVDGKYIHWEIFPLDVQKHN